MKYLKIQNNGILDIRLVALMGGTTKANDKFKIGQFGTGLKYTLAFLYRNNLDFAIFCGEERVQIHTEKELIRGEEFEIICINGQRTSITTKMGEDWEAWMIVRELWCNALDEGGAIKCEAETMEGEADKTTFYLQISSGIQDVLQQWNKYFIADGSKPIYENESCRLYPADKHLCIYKNGVLVYENQAVAGVFKYDILYAQINELREYKSAPSYDISCAIKSLDVDGIQYFLGHLTNDHYEGNNMDYNWFTKWGESWKSFLLGTKLLNENIESRYNDYGHSYNKKDYTSVPICVYDSLTKCFDGLGLTDALDEKHAAHDFYIVESPETEDKIIKCLFVLDEIGYSLPENLKYTYGFFNDKDTYFKIDAGRKSAMVSMGISQLSAIRVLCVLIEKREVYKQNALNNQVEIKNHFINLYTHTMLAGREIEI